MAAERSDLVILPEMAFAPWFAAGPTFDATSWQQAVAAHDAWQARLAVLAPTTPATPAVTIEIDLELAMAAKATYPRYVRE